MVAGRQPVAFCHLLRQGWEECADLVHKRIHKRQETLALIVDNAGRVFLRRPTAAERDPLAYWVGTYDPTCHVEDIESDLLNRQRELTAGIREAA